MPARCVLWSRTAGFNLSCSHVTDPVRVERLLVLLTVALTWAARTGVLASQLEPIPVKSHGRAEFSVFRFGLDVLVEILAGGARLLSFVQVLMGLFETPVVALTVRYAQIPACRSG